MTKLKDLKTRLLKDPAVRKEYDALEEEFALMAAVAKARVRVGLSQAATCQAHEDDAEHHRTAGKRPRQALDPHAGTLRQGDRTPAEDQLRAGAGERVVFLVMAGPVPAIPLGMQCLPKRGHWDIGVREHAVLWTAMPGDDKAVCNRAGNFSVGRLMEFLTALGQDVTDHGEADKERAGGDGSGGGVSCVVMAGLVPAIPLGDAMPS